jgi:hypothetical protein
MMEIRGGASSSRRGGRRWRRQRGEQWWAGRKGGEGEGGGGGGEHLYGPVAVCGAGCWAGGDGRAQAAAGPQVKAEKLEGMTT